MIEAGASCEAQPGGWAQATQEECESIAAEKGASFEASHDYTGEESGCMAWDGPSASSLEFMISNTAHPCAARTCYCTRA